MTSLVEDTISYPLNNAHEAMNGRGTIRVDVADCGDEIACSITGSGKGIPEERLAKLFDFGLSRSASRVKLGSSLVTARKIVREHCGDIEVASEVDRGTTSTVRLPKDIAPKPA